MFERFTDRARNALVLAHEEARLLDHNFIGTEHLLLGLIHEGNGVAAKALKALGISLEAVRERVLETIGPGGSFHAGSPAFTPRAKKVLELSFREALQLGHNFIGTEHVLLGVLREGEGVGAHVLQSLGADLGLVREQVIALLSGYRSEPDDLSAIDADLVAKTDLPMSAATLLGWDDAAAMMLAAFHLADAHIERTEVDGLVYETCTYCARLPPEVSVSVVGAKITREAFQAFRPSLSDGEDVEGLGDAATYSPANGSLRVLAGSTMFVVRISRHPHPKDAAIDAAKRALSNIERAK